jgi:Protein of unknown function (DUF1360)
VGSRFAKRRQRYLRTVRDPRRTPAGEAITADIDRRSISHAEAEAKGAAVPLPPLAGYALVGCAFGAAVVGVAAFGRPVERPSALDLALLAGATFKTARIVSRERLGSVVRAPFVEGDATSPDAAPAGNGLQRAIGELVTCTRCVGTWAALGLVAARTVAPRPGRLLITTLAVGAANDFMQAGFTVLCKAAEERRR